MSLLGKIGGVLKGAATGAASSLGGGVSKGGILGGAISGALGKMGMGGTPDTGRPSVAMSKPSIISDDPAKGGITGRLPRKKAFSKGFSVASRSMSGDR